MATFETPALESRNAPTVAANSTKQTNVTEPQIAFHVARAPTTPACPTFLRKCEALDGHFPENTMPYFPSRESWTWAVSPTNPPQPQGMSTPQLQLANPNHHSIRPQRQNRCCKEVRFEIPPLLTPRSILGRQMRAGPQSGTVSSHLKGNSRPPSWTSGAPNRPLPQLTTTLTNPLPLSLPNECTPTRSPVEPQNMAAKCTQIQNGAVLRPQHCQPQGLGHTSPTRALDQHLWQH